MIRTPDLLRFFGRIGAACRHFRMITEKPWLKGEMDTFKFGYFYALYVTLLNVAFTFGVQVPLLFFGVTFVLLVKIFADGVKITNIHGWDIEGQGKLYESVLGIILIGALMPHLLYLNQAFWVSKWNSAFINTIMVIYLLIFIAFYFKKKVSNICYVLRCLSGHPFRQVTPQDVSNWAFRYSHPYIRVRGPEEAFEFINQINSPIRDLPELHPNWSGVRDNRPLQGGSPERSSLANSYVNVRFQISPDIKPCRRSFSILPKEIPEGKSEEISNKIELEKAVSNKFFEGRTIQQKRNQSIANILVVEGSPHRSPAMHSRHFRPNWEEDLNIIELKSAILIRNPDSQQRLSTSASPIEQEPFTFSKVVERNEEDHASHFDEEEFETPESQSESPRNSSNPKIEKIELDPPILKVTDLFKAQTNSQRKRSTSNDTKRKVVRPPIANKPSISPKLASKPQIPSIPTDPNVTSKPPLIHALPKPQRQLSGSVRYETLDRVDTDTKDSNVALVTEPDG